MDQSGPTPAPEESSSSNYFEWQQAQEVTHEFLKGFHYTFLCNPKFLLFLKGKNASQNFIFEINFLKMEFVGNK